MAEFTIANYAARPNSISTGYSRRRDFGLITLSHPALFGEPGDSKMTEDALHELYDRREDPQSPSRLHERIDELFEAYDQDANGVLDIRELREALASLGLPPDDASVQRVLHTFGASSPAAVITRDQFAALLDEVGDQTVLGTVQMYFSTELHNLEASLSGWRAYNWIGRDSPAHLVVRALRAAWPEHSVVETALLRNVADNAHLEPEHMELLARVHRTDGSSGEFTATAAEIAEMACAHEPSQRGGLVIRLTMVGSDVVHHVPLRGLAENHVEGSSTFELTHHFQRDRRAITLIGAAIAVSAAGAAAACGAW